MIVKWKIIFHTFKLLFKRKNTFTKQQIDHLISFCPQFHFVNRDKYILQAFCKFSEEVSVLSSCRVLDQKEISALAFPLLFFYFNEAKLKTFAIATFESCRVCQASSILQHLSWLPRQADVKISSSVPCVLVHLYLETGSCQGKA